LDVNSRIAVIGVSCRFPGARDYAEFWANLRSGTESVTFFDGGSVPPELAATPGYVAAQGVVHGADGFDARLFGVSPTEAGLMDPQHRVLLECAWTALEDAGYGPTEVGRDHTVGVFAGAYHNGYAKLAPHTDDPAEAFLHGIGTDADYLCTRISYKLGLTGPSVSVQTACSTSLVAVHLAAESLLAGGCDMALAGGITLRSGEPAGYLHHKGGIYSPDGHTRAFDASAAGTVIGEGAGIVVLKRLSDAIADGDRVRAVVLGSAVGNDGADRVGFSAPGVAGQARIVRAALRRAGVSADRVRYVETHGSGTPLGDRIEVDALTRAFRAEGATTPAGCAIGSVKTNIGHTHAAAGIAGLIKTVAALEHRELPPSLHFVEPSQRLADAGALFRVNAELTPWPSGAAPRVAGVSSFGLGGTGAHVVLAEAPHVDRRSHGDSWQVLPLSAHEPAALEEATDRLASTLTERADLDLADVAHTHRASRSGLRHRRFTVARTTADAAQTLRTRDPARLFEATAPSTTRRVAFLLPGIGEQYPGMGRDLYEHAPVFRHELDRCFEVLRTVGVEPREVLWPDGETAESGVPRVDLRAMLGKKSVASELDRTRYAQPVVFAIEYALARLWMSLGVRPDALLGYSIGEYVAACLAGVLTLEDALLMVAERARLIDTLPAGDMLAVQLPERDVSDLLGAELSLAAVNGDDLCVVAGTPDAVAAAQRQLTEAGATTRLLRTTHAFHSVMMRPLVEPFTELAARVKLTPPNIPYLSNVTGDWITDTEATDPGYWARHLCQPVRFADGVRRLWVPGRVAIEVGPGQSLSGLALQSGASDVDTATLVLSSMPASYTNQSETAALLTTAGKLWLGGVPIDWAAWYTEPAHRIPLPTYPFQRQRYSLAELVKPVPTMAKKADLTDWFHLPEWVDDPVPVATPAAGRWWLFADDSELAAALAARLAERGEVIRVRAGDVFERTGPAGFTIRPDVDADYASLVATVGLPTRVVHQWLVGGGRSVDAVLAQGFHSLLGLAKAIGGAQTGERIDVTVLSTGLHALDDPTAGEPAKATVLGPVRVWPQENVAVTCRSVDLTEAAVRTPRLRSTVDNLLAELDATRDDRVIAYQGGRRRRQVFRPVRITEPNGRPWSRPGGVYLITGGLGGIGLALARHLARAGSAKLVLVSRAALPDRSTWSALLATADPDSAETRQRVRGVLDVEACGGEVLVCAADVTDTEQLHAVFATAERRFGAVHGVVHAAGVPGAGIIQLKTRAAADAVLAAKVAGTVALARVCAARELDFLLLCSSGLAVTGGAGQVDYVAANAFLDAFAHRADATGGTPTVSVNWDAWRDHGMAARTIDTDRRLEHRWVDRCVVDHGDFALYAARFDGARSWLVDEHRMLGRPVVPGVAHLELVRAAFAHHRDLHGGIEFRDVTFYAPIVLGDDEHKEVRIVLRVHGDRTRFAVVGRATEEPSARWQLHSTGEVDELVPAARRKIDLAARADRLTDLGRPEHTGPMGFGARSRNLRRMYAGEREFLATIELDSRFGDELAGLPLHPALLDIATAFVGLHVAAEFRIPLSYRRIRVYGPLTATINSHHRLDEADRAGKPTVTADVTVTDADGTELLVAEGFVLKKVDDLDHRLTQAHDGSSEDLAYYTFPDGVDPDAVTDPDAPVFLRDSLAEGMDQDEGVAVFDRILGAGVTPQVLVTTKDLAAVIARAERSVPLVTAPDTPAVTKGHTRPALSTPYVSPRNETERTLAELWQQTIGVDRIGVHDPFFELGGHSLLGLRLLGRLRELFAVDIPVGTFFDAPTIAAQADAVNGMRRT
jgi:acyl transferase domain-containing protein